MNDLSSAIRPKRFDTHEGQEVLIEVEIDGRTVELLVANASANGLLAAVEQSHLATESGLEIGAILPSSLLRWNGTSASLGRLVVRRIEEHEGWRYIAFSLVDQRFPMSAQFGQAFAGASNNGSDPLGLELNAAKFSFANFAQSDYRSPDLFQKCRDFQHLRDDMKQSGRLPYYGVRHQVDGARWRISLPDHPKPGPYVNFASYDYLGMSQEPEVHEALKKAVDRYGISATASPINSGQSGYHEELEHYLARLLRKEDCLLFASGFNANLGTLASLLTANDLAVADFLCHASIQDGLGGVKAKVRHFRHNDNIHFERILSEERASYAGTLALTEGLFSMDGDIPDLREFVRISKQYGARTFIDEVHSFGIIGPDGLGAAEQQGVLDDFDLYTGSLSKVPGTGGGFVVGSKAAIGWLRYFARCGMFSTALSPCMAAASLKSIEIMQRDGSRRKKLRENIRHFRAGLEELGFPLLSAPESPIIPVVIPDQEKLVAAHRILLDQKVFVNVIVYPAVAMNQSRFRFSVTANHSFSDIELALAGLNCVACRY